MEHLSLRERTTAGVEPVADGDSAAVRPVDGAQRRLPGRLHRGARAPRRRRRRRAVPPRRSRAPRPRRDAAPARRHPRAEQLHLGAIAPCPTRPASGRRRECGGATSCAARRPVDARRLARELRAYVASRFVLRLRRRDARARSARAPRSARSRRARSVAARARPPSRPRGSACALVQDRARVERRHHLHDRDAGLGESLADRRLDRRRAAQRGQQRRVDVERAEPRQVDHRLRAGCARTRRRR